MRAQLFSYCTFAFLFAINQTCFAQQQLGQNQLAIPPRVLPLSPKEVLALLPATPTNWRTTTSLATNQVSSWLITIAQRQIEGVADKHATSGTNSPPMRTTFVLIDTGFDPSSAGAFVDFKTMQGTGAEKILLKGYPTIRTRPSATSESLQMFINQRFVLRIDAENQPKDATLGWAERVPFDRYNPPRTAALTTLPAEVIITTVDELNPVNNHESKTTIGQHAPVRR
jgi:hypothetical protein